MNIPKKHHFIPRVHIRKFKTDGKYIVLDKKNSECFLKTSSVDIFSIREFNTSIDIQTGEINHSYVEEELTNLWDSKFQYNYQLIEDYITNSLKRGYEDAEEVKPCLQYFFEYGILQYFRSIKANEKGINSFIGFEDLFEIRKSIEKLKQQGHDFTFIEEFMNKLEELHKNKEQLKFPNDTITDVRLFTSTNISCDIIMSSHTKFILPDNPVLVTFSKLFNEYHGFKYNKFSTVGFPVSPSLYLQFKNNECLKNKGTYIYEIGIEKAEMINNKLLDNTVNFAIVNGRS